MIRTEIVKSAPALLRERAAELGAKTAFEDKDRKLSYAALDENTARLAGGLARAGLAAGDRVALYLPNSVDWVEACFAVLRAGGVAVPIAYDSTADEVGYRLTDADCRFVVTTEERREIAAGDGRTLLLVDQAEDAAGALSYDAMRADMTAPAPRDPDDIDGASFIVYTSGTTGRPKGVLLSQRSMFWVTAAAWAPAAGLNADDRVLSPLPLFHSYALNFSVLSIVAVGASEYILDRFSTDRALDLLDGGGFTVFPGVPTMFHYLLETARSRGAAPQGLRICLSAGAIMPATLNREFETAFGVTLLDGYGITETATMVTMNWPTGGRVLGSCGLPVPGLATRIVDPATGADAAVGEEGELIVRGPNLMLGYHNKPEETAAALKEGWYRTGDLAKADANGYLTITGRLKELIIRGGQNIAPAEIEEVANAYDGVLDCAVAGAPHPHLGETPAIFVVPRDAGAFSADGLIAHCKDRLSAYKIPTAVHIVDAIPRTGSGKVMRFKLTEAVDS